MRSQCPKLAKDRSTEVINHIREDLDLGECFEPYVKKAMFAITLEIQELGLTFVIVTL